MDHITRLTAAFALQATDRPRSWRLAAPGHIQRSPVVLTTTTGPTRSTAWAERPGIDGVIGIACRSLARIAAWTAGCWRTGRYTVDTMLAEIAALPEPEQMRAKFDEEREYADLKAELNRKQAQAGEMLWCPADWDIIPSALWYSRFGYENALMLPKLHPEAHRKLLRTSAERGRLHAILRARAIREGIHPRAILTGEDLCSQRGPMISTDFLRREYWPLVEYAIEPVLAAGGRLVWHCDGDVRSLLPDVLAAGFAGLQGFQRECGMDLEWIVNWRAGDPLLIFNRCR
jgi:hypothetical protein